MSDSNAQPTGDDLLTAVSASMIALHERYYHRVPATARAQLVDDELLTCMLTGVYTDVEQALIGCEQGELVRLNRAAIQGVMRETSIGEVQRLSGRAVVAFQCANHIDPDLEVVLFWLSPV